MLRDTFFILILILGLQRNASAQNEIFEGLRINSLNQKHIKELIEVYNDSKINDSNRISISHQINEKYLKILRKIEITDTSYLVLKTIFSQLNYWGTTKKLTLITFWFYGCQPCHNHAAILNNLYKKFNSKINFLSFCRDKSKGNNTSIHVFPTLYNLNNIMTYFGIESYPQTFIIDSKNRIIIKHIGSGKSDSLIKDISTEIQKTF